MTQVFFVKRHIWDRDTCSQSSILKIPLSTLVECTEAIQLDYKEKFKHCSVDDDIWTNSDYEIYEMVDNIPTYVKGVSPDDLRNDDPTYTGYVEDEE